MQYNNTIRLLLIVVLFLSISFTPSFSLTESVDLFGEVNSVDLVLNDIWISPENPKKGQAVTVHGSLYNAGVVSTGKVSDAVTVAYIINGEISEINLLEDISPGIENGIVISSGPIFNAISEKHVITVIVNYHDTLSHLRDNPENNIVQKIFHFGTKTPSIINFEIFQEYNNKTGKQQITVEGETKDIFLKKLQNQEIIINIEGKIQEKISSDAEGKFLFKTNMPFKDKPVKISTYIKETSLLHSFSQMMFPIKIEKEESALALEIISESPNNTLKNSTLTVVLFQDSYDNVFKKIIINEINRQSLMNENFFLTILPSDHKYITEIYIDGRLLDAFQNYFPSNNVIKKEISISESSQVQFRVVDDLGKPQSNVRVENWVYSDRTDGDGFTDWIKIIPTFTVNEPYVAKAIFPNGEIIWSEPFLIESEEKKVIIIVKGDSNP